MTPQRGDYIYSRGFRCWVAGETCQVYGGTFHVTIYDEGPNAGRRNLIAPEQFSRAPKAERPVDDSGYMI